MSARPQVKGNDFYQRYRVAADLRWHTSYILLGKHQGIDRGLNYALQDGKGFSALASTVISVPSIEKAKDFHTHN